MSCAQTSPLLRSRIDRELDAVDEAAVAAHLSSCPDCRRREDILRRVVEGLRSLPDLEGADAPPYPLPAGAAQTWRRLAAFAAAAVVLVAACRKVYDLLDSAMHLNRQGAWDIAVRSAEDALKEPGVSGSSRCAARLGAANGHLHAEREHAAEHHLSQFEVECGFLAADHPFRREARGLRSMMTKGTPAWALRQAMGLNRQGEWGLAARTAAAVLEMPEASPRERCEALHHAAYARLRLKQRNLARSTLAVFDASCSSVRREDWLWRETRRVRKELEPQSKGGPR